MVEFLNATQSKGEIERILTTAKYDIVVISPFIKISGDLISRLIDAGNRNVQTMLICREEDLQAKERAKLENTPNLKLRFNERVHAKCFYNENSMVITSLNLYTSSLGDNREMGVLLRRDIQSDNLAFEDAKSEAQFIIRESASNPGNIEPVKIARNYNPIGTNEPKPIFKAKPPKKDTIEDTIVRGISGFFGISNGGHCIRCGGNISFKLESPYCPDCYKTWARYKDPTYKEKICHKCGHPSETSMKRPLCTNCYKSNI